MIYFVFSEKDPAGKNMASLLLETENFVKTGDIEDKAEVFVNKDKNWVIIKTKTDIIYTDFLEGKLYDCDFCIFLSRHSSERAIKSLTVHTPGNWIKEAKFGGKPEDLSISNAILQTELLREIYHNNPFNDFLVCFEVTHHGPTLNYPVTFYEIGSTETEWRNEKIAEFMIEVLLEVLKEFERRKRKIKKVCLGIGGPHYAPFFTDFILNEENEEYAVGHIIPKYVFDKINFKKMIPLAIKKTVPEVNTILAQKKGINKEIKEIVESIVKDLKCFGKEVGFEIRKHEPIRKQL